jgi:hypothetical protein
MIATRQGFGTFRAKIKKQNLHLIDGALFEQTAQRGGGPLSLASHHQHD